MFLFMEQGKGSAKGKHVFRYGNYDRYYGYRLSLNKDESDQTKIWSDPRVLIMKKVHFKKKLVLDIGCNAGYLSIALAQQLRPRLLVGIDLDGILIAKARKVLNFRALQLINEKKLIEGPKTVVLDTKRSNDDFQGDEDDPESILQSLTDYHTKEPSMYHEPLEKQEINASLFRSFPYNIYFKTENILTDVHYTQKYDTITCFSVTKWIQLNWGDNGLIYLFLKAYSLLHQYGVFIVEYQPWSSYHKKCHYSEVLKDNYDSIQIRPEHFPRILERIGFRMVSNHIPNRTQEINHSITKGFNRNIAVFKKVGKELDFDIRNVTLDSLENYINIKNLISSDEISI